MSIDKVPIILTGPPGCGKSYWIQKYAEKMGKQLFICPCRKDRTLRDGRQKLHIWARRTEPAILWLEGADDLTPEAQAFLRRILETVSTSVQCILECRDPQRITPAIQSRCEWKQCSFKQSFRKEKQKKIVGDAALIKTPPATTCLDAFHAAEQPIDSLKEFLQHPTLWQEAILSLKAVGGGSSPWAQLYNVKALNEDIRCVQ
jgi:hypothetical protein